ncbi:5-oxoprolinase subunit PxpA [uncultured Paraglaciecola sp.]|uniref:5-oxoprolinase subunit PxpA n=1 Tax=uncultured Paraglaciecola sp. TaxID=1765024 RepID=UPI0030DDBA5E|tara:strand:- start:397516 stop:398244 length:729 start_codon:yes stop_codon:yes gene_type:complete
MKLNCDLGESFGIWQLGQDDKLMPHIDMANIACGFHAGDAHVIHKTLQLAKQHKVEVGAHPSYPDKLGFGRRSMLCSKQEIIELVHYQVAALDGMAKNLGIDISYVKPHGALYNDMMSDESVCDAIFEAISSYHRPLKLMLLATPKQQRFRDQADASGITLIFEAFSDRRYTENGHLMSRKDPQAVLNEAEMIQQVTSLMESGEVICDTGKKIPLQADSLCVHGDNDQAIKVIQELKRLCQN